jgi:hypothetical protein
MIRCGFSLIVTYLLIAVCVALPVWVPSSSQAVMFSVCGDQVCLDGKPFKVIGLRCSNALVSDEETQELIQNLSVFRAYGVNTVSVFLMGSRFGDVKGYNPDTTLNPVYVKRLKAIIQAADRQDMVVLIGCLYWSTSKAKDALKHWSQQEANQAIAHTVRWVTENHFTNVFIDPDNEGMAHRETGWSIAEMIDAAHTVSRDIPIAYNDRDTPPPNADILVHFSPKDGKRPYIESEGSPAKTPNGYWGRYSKEEGYYNYIRIGRYTEDMKASQIAATRDHVERHSGYILASTWIQCAPHEGVNGPFMNPGGRSLNMDIDENVKTLHPDAGIRWWLEWVKATYGPWEQPQR